MRLILKLRQGLFVGVFAALDAGKYFTNDCDRAPDLFSPCVEVSFFRVSAKGSLTPWKVA
jgi:hypothetical protein